MDFHHARVGRVHSCRRHERARGAGDLSRFGASGSRRPRRAAARDVWLRDLPRLRDEFGEGLPILFVSGFRTEALDRVAGLLVGGDDYLVKPFAPDELIGRVRVLTRRRGLSNGSSWGLTRREDEVLRLLASGLRQEEIASRLVVSPRTVGAHIQNVLRKMGATSRTQAVALAYRRDLRTS